MEMPKFTHGYKGGINKDISPNEYPNTCYLDARNLRVIVDSSEGLSTASLSTPRGNLPSFTLPDLTYYMGHAVLRDKLIILAKHLWIEDAYPDKIYVLNIADVITGTNVMVSGAHLVYEQNLNFQINHPIKIVANYENADVQKIYWVDGINPLRHLNIVSNPDYNNLSTLHPELLNILPNHTYGSYELTELTGGHLKAGRIQYSYQLYSVSGTETMFAPPSKLYNLTSYDIADGINFIGDELEKEVNKSIRITVNLEANVTSIFNRIRLVALEYETYGDVPTVRVVAELELGHSSVSFVDSGNSIGELLLEEFQQVRNEIIPTTIETKNNYLFAGNITQEFFDIDDLVKEITNDSSAFLDTRAYRWKYVEGGFDSASGSQELDDLTDPNAILNTPGYPNAAQAYDVAIIEAYNTSWHIHVTIRPDLHAAAQVPVRTVTGVSSLNGLGCNIRLRTAGTMIWDEQGIALNFEEGAYIDGYDPVTHSLSIRGTKYWGTPPQDLTPPWSYGNYDADALTQFSYTYTYTYMTSSGDDTYQCVLNKTHAVDGLPRTSPEFVLDDGVTGPDYDSVDPKNDCINTYNNINYSRAGTGDHAFKFRYGVGGAPQASDLGGTGKFISFSFITHALNSIASRRSIGSGSSINYVLDPYNMHSHANPQVVMDYTSAQRDEVYRYAIGFYDLEGRPSFAKWIADIRFPDVNEYLSYGNYTNAFNFTSVDTSNPNQTVNAVALGIRFTINWNSINQSYPGLLDQISGFQILRVPRTDLDCTIKAQGLIVPTHKVTVPDDPNLRDASHSSYNITSSGDYDVGANGITQITGITGTNASINDTLVELLSPEVAINKNLDSDDDDFLEAVGHISNVSRGSIRDTQEYLKSYTVVATTITPFNSRVSGLFQTVSDAYLSLPEAKLAPIRVIGGDPYVARGYDDSSGSDDPEMTYKGTTLVAKIEFPFNNITPSTYSAGDEQAIFGRYRRPLGFSIYGGATYSERSYSNYVDASGFIKLTEEDRSNIRSYSIYDGDTYIAPFNFLKLFYDYKSEYMTSDGRNSGQVLVGFPVESRINLYYKLDNIPKYFTTVNRNALYYLTEQASIGVSQHPSGYPDIYDLYRYNSAYSTESLSKIFLPKPFDYRRSKVNDVMVTSSERKFNGEYSDSWLKFKFNNYLELEGEYGAITRLINNNERLIAFQPRGISVLSVLEREVIESNNTASLVVGSGGILSRYDYLSKLVGTSLYYAIAPAETGIYFYDDNNMQIYRILEAIEPISDVKGMKSYFESIQSKEMITAYDRANREVLFTSSDRDTLCFSGFTDAFSSFYSFNLGAAVVQNYITFDRYLLSSLDRREFYIHNVGDYNNFYGENKISSLTLITNPLKDNVVSFHVIDWLTDLTTGGVETMDDLVHTFDTLRISNTHQDTGILILDDWISAENLMRRFRKWRINTFRDLSTGGRIRDSWIKTNFVWQQKPINKKLVVHQINYLYLPTKIR
jgi:hypothetical protein